MSDAEDCCFGIHPIVVRFLVDSYKGEFFVLL